MATGMFGYFGYDMITHFEKIKINQIDDLNLHDAILIDPQ